MAKEILATFGVDIDAVSGWLGSYGGADSPSDIQRGVWAGEIGTVRLLKLFERHKLKASWFIPGHSIETFPRQVQQIAAAGHEIGAHGYAHENPVSMTPRQEEDVLEKSVELIERLTGRRPRGYVAPWWEMSSVTAELLLKNGFRYDHSQAYRDFVPFYARVGDRWDKVDYSKPAAEWMHPLDHGHEIDLVEIGANWYLDDLLSPHPIVAEGRYRQGQAPRLKVRTAALNPPKSDPQAAIPAFASNVFVCCCRRVTSNTSLHPCQSGTEFPRRRQRPWRKSRPGRRWTRANTPEQVD
ncbi:MAG: polysaccharide deacetylase family protein [Dehalococcoidia bacterium]|nr:polysaccharide deacetylase family protein [Dehalococcoidia bacterium]